MMALNATSSTVFGSTSRTWPWSAVVCARNHSVNSAISLSVSPEYALPMVTSSSPSAHREGVIAQHMDAFAMSELRCGHHDVERGQLAFQFEHQRPRRPGM